MHPAALQAAFGAAVAGALATVVLLRRERTSLTRSFLALVLALAWWSGAAVWRFSADDPDELMAAFRMLFLGVYAVPPLWVLFAARLCRVRIAEDHPTAAGTALALPSVAAWLAFLTNDAHHLFAREITMASFVYGPLFWVFVATSYAEILLGIGFCLAHAWKMAERQQWVRAGLLVLGALVPLAANAIYLFHLLPVRYDPTAPALSVSALLLFAAVFGFRLLESVPLARRDVIENLREAVFITDARGVLRDANPAAVALLGGDRRALIGRELPEILVGLGGESGSALLAAWRGVAPGRAPVTVSAKTPDHRFLDLTFGAVGVGAGHLLGTFAVIRDRTEERRFELLRAQGQKLETLGRLAAGLAHEVATPVSYVVANLAEVRRLAAAMAEEKPVDPEELAELPDLVADALEGVERIRAVVEDLRRFSRLPADDLAWVDVSEVARVSLRLARLQSRGAPEVEARLEDRLPRVRGSAHRLSQAVLNLLVNAAQAVADRPDGRVRIETRRAGNEVEIRVSDNGPGVPEAVRRRIFDPFFTTKGPEEGTGLGLAIAMETAADHGGRLDVEPSAEGGASFFVRLPIEPPEAGEAGAGD